ncbi:MAG: hypothetical protein A2Z72_05610 [Omnitrophica bacterium RBG_13_46_9]|nr:MAG: hypothetical protein A2Z72_05610 [Omnitrophica bacterium RBG_13_46_9]
MKGWLCKKGVMGKFSFLKELWGFLATRKKWWLLPILIVLLLLGLLIIFTESSAVAPFIYTLF